MLRSAHSEFMKRKRNSDDNCSEVRKDASQDQEKVVKNGVTRKERVDASQDQEKVVMLEKSILSLAVPML